MFGLVYTRVVADAAYIRGKLSDTDLWWRIDLSASEVIEGEKVHSNNSDSSLTLIEGNKADNLLINNISNMRYSLLKPLLMLNFRVATKSHHANY